MQQSDVKSATTAGILGIFLGAFGAHNWYLGEKSKGIIHVCMMSAGILVEIVAAAVLPNVLSLTSVLRMAWMFSILSTVAGLAMMASAVWGLAEGVNILTQGDAGLARKGYKVAQPMMGQGPNLGGFPQNNGQQNYNQQQQVAQQPAQQPPVQQPPVDNSTESNPVPQQPVNQDNNVGNNTNGVENGQ